mmetsp:Transcript_2420/g.3600  ORF Transcript_2420/g.3600 Transcript_2420/m.3600 type:complete len:238 (-) Transcript_2420:629-1342(-)
MCWLSNRRRRVKINQHPKKKAKLVPNRRNLPLMQMVQRAVRTKVVLSRTGRPRPRLSAVTRSRVVGKTPLGPISRTSKMNNEKSKYHIGRNSQAPPTLANLHLMVLTIQTPRKNITGNGNNITNRNKVVKDPRMDIKTTAGTVAQGKMTCRLALAQVYCTGKNEEPSKTIQTPLRKMTLILNLLPLALKRQKVTLRMLQMQTRPFIQRTTFLTPLAVTRSIDETELTTDFAVHKNGK